MKRLLLALGALFLVATGCDLPDRVGRLEKQTKELRADVDKNRAELDRRTLAADLDSQAKCSKDAKEWFKENWGSSDKDTILLDYSNHYNRRLNKCFLSLEWHYWIDKNSKSWRNHMDLWDVYENSKYGSVSEDHMNFPKTETKEKVFRCELLDKTCKTVQEWNGLAYSYLND